MGGRSKLATDEFGEYKARELTKEREKKLKKQNPGKPVFIGASRRQTYFEKRSPFEVRNARASPSMRTRNKTETTDDVGLGQPQLQGKVGEEAKKWRGRRG